MSLEAAPQSPTVVRAHARAWLAELRWPATAAGDVVLAVNEAVTNAVTHASAPQATPPRRAAVPVRVWMAVEAHEPGRRLLIRVRDHGTWQPADPARGGYGLVLMRELMDHLELVHPGTGGTEVTMISPTVSSG
ncbi:MAG: ATP-binding protein [Pseudonocardia sp.]|nr:ATP-binding protein [Pseudonocardia sp.]